MKSLADWWSGLADLMGQSLRMPARGQGHRRAQKAARQGWLVPVGGNVLHDDVVVNLIHLAGGRRQPAVVIAIATTNARDLGAGLAASLHRFGVEEVALLPLSIGPGNPDLDPTNPDLDPASVRRIAAARLIIIGGDEAAHVTTALTADPIWPALSHAFQQGAVIAAVGAAAAAIGTVSPPKDETGGAPLLHWNGVGGKGAGSPSIFTGGLKLNKRVVVDSEIVENDQLGRLLYMAAHQPDLLALGLAAGTAAIIGPGDDLRVVGQGVAVVVDGRRVRGGTARDAKPRALCDLKVHVLPAGYGFDLVSRRPLTPAAVAGGGVRGLAAGT